MTDTITTELRESMVDDARGLLYIGETALADLCDAIDAVHAQLERENEALKSSAAHAYASGYEYAEQYRDGWVELPKDADGEYTHIGDVLDGYGKTIEVVELRIGRSGWVLISRDGSGYADTFAFTHHAPTVEDVLREFAVEVCGEPALTIRSGVVEEYAAKLRLAGES